MKPSGQNQSVVQPIVQTCMFCLENCPSVVYVSPVCGCPASYHLPCKQTWDREQPHTCPICRNVLIYVVNSKHELNTQFVGKHPDEAYVSLPGGVAPSAPPPSVTVTVATGPHVPSSEEQQRSSRNQRIFAMVFTVIMVVFIIIMLKVMAG
jgi:hypothetical protein